MDGKKSSVVVNFIVRAVLGLGIIFFTNEFLASRDIPVSVGLNGVSLMTSGILGFPGVCLLYGILFYQIL